MSPSEKRQMVAIRFPAHLHARLKEIAAERDVSMNYLVTKAIKKYLERAQDSSPSADGLGKPPPATTTKRKPPP